MPFCLLQQFVNEEALIAAKREHDLPPAFRFVAGEHAEVEQQHEVVDDFRKVQAPFGRQAQEELTRRILQHQSVLKTFTGT